MCNLLRHPSQQPPSALKTRPLATVSEIPLRDEPDVRTREIKRRNVIIMNLSDSLKALPAPLETQQAETPNEPESGAETRSGRPWWVFWRR